jgi:hypothetical protein
MSHQQSDKHGPAIDDSLQDAGAGTRYESRSEDDPLGPDPDIEVRAEVARFLGPAAFPGDRAHLVAVAAENHATPEVRGLLERLPDRTYETLQEAVDSL